LARTFYGFRLAKLKLRDNSSFNILNGFLEAFPKIKYVGSGSGIMENTIEITVFLLFENSPLNIA